MIERAYVPPRWARAENDRLLRRIAQPERPSLLIRFLGWALAVIR